jgi:hypothetical protein
MDLHRSSSWADVNEGLKISKRCVQSEKVPPFVKMGEYYL